MTDLIEKELTAIPELSEELAQFGIAHRPPFRNLSSAMQTPSSGRGSAFLTCDVLE
jgi:hypothetical protein